MSRLGLSHTEAGLLRVAMPPHPRLCDQPADIGPEAMAKPGLDKHGNHLLPDAPPSV